MALELSPERREEVLKKLRGAYVDEFDESLSDFRAAALLDLVLKAVGPAVYNQAVKDTQAFIQSRLDDLDGEVKVYEG